MSGRIAEIRRALRGDEPGRPTPPLTVTMLACPWCGSGPRSACVALGSGAEIIDSKTGRAIGRRPDLPLTTLPAHPARYRAAGVDVPVPSLPEVAA